MKKFTIAIVVFCCMSVSGCTTFDVVQDYDISYDYQQLKKYAWLPGLEVALGDGRIDDQTAKMRVKQIVEAELAGKGFTKVALGKEDFLLGFHVALNKPLYRDKLYEASIKKYKTYTVIRAERSEYRPPSFDVGTLVLDVIIPDTDKIIWRGSVETEFQIDYVSVEKRKKRLEKAVRKLLKDFPPKN